MSILVRAEDEPVPTRLEVPRHDLTSVNLSGPRHLAGAGNPTTEEATR
jgi:hypothetical protein